MGSTKQLGIGLYEFLIESELQQYYNAIKNDLKVQSVTQLKYVSDDDMTQIGMSRPEIRRLKKFFHKHCPQTYLAKMKKKLLSRREDAISVASMSTSSQNAPGRVMKSIAPGRHIIQAESIVIHKTLGSGEFGTVQQGVWTSDDGQRTQVAIKCLSQERMENNPVEFLKEAAIMHTVDHEHIVRLYGVVLDTSALMLVTELAPLRSLLECLKEPSMRRNLSVPTLYDFAVQICDGMQYLESKRLIHRDLAARNILVFSRSKVKISDFGLSRALGVGKDYYQTNFNVNLKLPIAWCAPECINFLRFTSASDVWAYGVALWEMFSYGFQPWAALTGQQILEAIDEPNYQRLERPECCPNEIYCQIMLKCWQHDPIDRPTFTQLSHLILECKPETVQAIRESEAKPRRDFLVYDAGDVITVIDRMPPQTSDETMLWKGVLKCGKSGLFHPGNTITYLGSSLPSVAQSNSPFHRNDSRSSSMRKGKISADMISGPQGDLKHTGHVGTDGQFFGDITFLGSKCWVPRQVVSPYKPEELPSEAGSSSGPRPGPQCSTRNGKDATQEMSSSDTIPLLDTTTQGSTDDGSKVSTVTTTAGRRGKHNMMVSIPGSTFNSDQDQDHEYHEISDEENEIMGAIGGCRASSVGLSNPALSSKSQSPLDSPRFEKSFDLGMGPSLIDEVFSALQHDSHQQPVEAHNVKNELREMARAKKKFASVKPISSSDRRTLDQAIVFVNELASRSMLDLDRSGKNGLTNNSLDDISSPRTPNSPSHRRKFSFILGSGKNDKERRNYSQEAASIPDIQSTLTEEAKEAYNSLVEKPSMNTLGFLTPSFENKSMSFHFPEKCSSLSKKADFFEPESKTLNGPQSLIEISPTCSNNAALVSSSNLTSFPGKSHSRSLSKSEFAEDNNHPQHHHTISSPSSSSSPMSPPAPILLSTASESAIEEDVEEEDEVDGNPLRLLRQNKQAFMTKANANVLPLPPKKGRGGSGSGSHSSTLSTRHQRKHPLLIPGRISSLSSTPSDSNNTITNSVATAPREPPVPPPKPQRQLVLNSNSNSISSPIPTSTPILLSSQTENNSEHNNDNILLDKPETAFASSTEPVEKTSFSPEKDIGIAQGGNQCQGNTDITLETNNHRQQVVGQRPSLYNSENLNSVKKLNVRQRLSASSFTTTENREREPCTLFTSENVNLISNTNGHPNPNSDRYRYSRDRPDSSILLYENILAEGSVGSPDSILNACVQVVNKNSSSSISNNCNAESQCQNQSNVVSSSSFTAPTTTATTVTPNGSGTTETLEDHPIRSRNRLNSDNSCSLAGAGTGLGNYKRLSSSSVASAVSLTPSSRNSSSSVLTEQSFQSTNESSNSTSMNNSNVTLNKNSELSSSSTASTVSSMVTARGFHSRSGSISIVKDLSIVPSTMTTTTVATAATIAVNNADTTPVSESVPAQNPSITIISHPMKITPRDSVKIKKLQRIVGPSTSEEECDWALDATDAETNHAVKLLRLKYLLPESLITEDARPLVSALEMSHWDVARASDFLLNSNAPNAKPKSSRPVTKRTSLRTELTNLLPPPSTSSSNDVCLNSNLRTDLINNNGTPRNTTTSTHNDSTNSGDGPNRRSYIRPTHV